MNRIAAMFGFAVDIRDDAAGTVRRISFPGNRDDLFDCLLSADFFDDMDDPERGEAELVAHIGEDSAVIRFWSGLEPAEARQAVAATILRFEEAVQ